MLTRLEYLNSEHPVEVDLNNETGHYFLACARSCPATNDNKLNTCDLWNSGYDYYVHVG